jgi:hypothetical protein
VRLSVCITFALFAGFAGVSTAQDTTSGDSQGQRMRAPDRVFVTTTTAFTSSPSGWLGKTPDRGLFIGAVRMSWRLAGSESGASVGYFVEAIPVAFVTGNPTAIESLESCIERYPEWRRHPTIPAIEYFENCAVNSARAYGGGFTPFGLSARFVRPSGLAFVAETWLGGIVFDKSVPYPNTTRFNYNLAAGTSVEIPLRGRTLLSIGYHMHHLSNGGRGDFNPGILAHSVQLGWGRRR